jgi:hypothetical protein
MPGTLTLVLLILFAFVAASATGVALSIRRGQLAERRRMQRKMVSINEQYRLVRQTLHDTETGRDQLRLDLKRSEDGRDRLDLLCRQLEEEVRGLKEERQRQREELAQARSVADVAGAGRETPTSVPATPEANGRPQDQEIGEPVSEGEQPTVRPDGDQATPGDRGIDDGRSPSDTPSAGAVTAATATPSEEAGAPQATRRPLARKRARPVKTQSEGAQQVP